MTDKEKANAKAREIVKNMWENPRDYNHILRGDIREALQAEYDAAEDHIHGYHKRRTVIEIAQRLGITIDS